MFRIPRDATKRIAVIAAIVSRVASCASIAVAKAFAGVRGFSASLPAALHARVRELASRLPPDWADRMRRVRSQSLQTYIVTLFLLLMVVVQVGGFALINTVGMKAARKSISEDLVGGALVFERLLYQDTHRLVQGASLMSSDYTFREVVASGDRDTIASVLAKYARRIDASLMMIVSLDQRVLGDTLNIAAGKPFAFPELIADARGTEKAAAMVLIDGRLYQLVVVPVLAPTPIAWVAIGFVVDDTLTQDFRRLTRLDVSFFSRHDGNGWRLQASTLDSADRRSLLANLAADRLSARDADGNAEYSDGAVSGVIVSILASLAIARRVARPVRELASVARRIAAGDYSTTPASSGVVEIGDLAAAFRAMQDDIASRESRIMDLAYCDPLTQLPNRALCNDRLD